MCIRDSIKKVQKANPNFIRKNENDPLKEEIEKEMEILGEGEISDVEKLMKKGMNAQQIGKKKGYSPRRIKALANMMILMKQLQKIESASAKLGFKPYQPSRSQQVQEEHERAKQSPFKLKSQQLSLIHISEPTRPY